MSLIPLSHDSALPLTPLSQDLAVSSSAESWSAVSLTLLSHCWHCWFDFMNWQEVLILWKTLKKSNYRWEILSKIFEAEAEKIWGCLNFFLLGIVIITPWSYSDSIAPRIRSYMQKHFWVWNSCPGKGVTEKPEDKIPWDCPFKDTHSLFGLASCRLQHQSTTSTLEKCHKAHFSHSIRPYGGTWGSDWFLRIVQYIFVN